MRRTRYEGRIDKQKGTNGGEKREVWGKNRHWESRKEKLEDEEGRRGEMEEEDGQMFTWRDTTRGTVVDGGGEHRNRRWKK